LTLLGKNLLNIYDFDDNWKHSITLEEISDTKVFVANCIAGKGACPPEDCGDVSGYYNLLEIRDWA
jgi:hypothetical protein